MTDYSALRRLLHAHPQTAGEESFAHDTIVRHLRTLQPLCIHPHVGGYGVAAVWGQNPDSDTYLFRADTDALPSGHRCGHDGHTAILLRLAEEVDRHLRHCPHKNIMLLWQPAEETGQGAQRVLDDGVLDRYRVRAVFGLHNLPGYPLATAVLCRGTFAAASAGVEYGLEGRETHASTPELGLNPGLAVAELVQAMQRLNHRGRDGFRQSTLICLRLGEPAFGTSAGQAQAMFTLRAFSNADMERLMADADAAAEGIAARHGLHLTRRLHDPFRATENTPHWVEAIEKAATKVPLNICYREEPFRWSEDFANYLSRYPGAMFGIGAGQSHAELHHPSYDFPDALIEPAAQMLFALADAL